MSTNLYPLKFQPILKTKIWGGNKLEILLNKKSSLPNVGESWEISDVDGNVSTVSNGFLKGKTLNELLHIYKSDLVGVNNFEQFEYKFPLLIKFIDANKDLSIQLHPNDDIALKRHNSFGKTEMWYVMQADTDSNIIVGFNQNIDKKKYQQHLKDKTLTKILNFEKVKSGDTYFINVGRIHAIGAGVMLAEIQQTSDITYRVYDWDRVDEKGNKRELHNDLAIDAIDFNLDKDYKIEYPNKKNTTNTVVKCPYFTTNYLLINSILNKENTHGSFVIYMCVNGQVNIETKNFSETINKGETILLPAAVKTYKLISNNAELLEIYV